MKPDQRKLLERTLGVIAYLSLVLALFSTYFAIEESYLLNDLTDEYFIELITEGRYSVAVYTAPLSIVCFWLRSFIRRGG